MSDDSVQVQVNLPTLRRGAPPSSGPIAVIRLQRMLNDRGLGPLSEDGDFGPKTEAAVKAFQGNEGLTADGIVGKQTWTALLTAWLLSSEGC